TCISEKLVGQRLIDDDYKGRASRVGQRKIPPGKVRYTDSIEESLRNPVGFGADRMPRFCLNQIGVLAYTAAQRAIFSDSGGFDAGYFRDTASELGYQGTPLHGRVDFPLWLHGEEQNALGV